MRFALTNGCGQRGYSRRVVLRPMLVRKGKLVPQFMENVTTPDQYEILEMNRISGFVNRAKGLGRPTKKDRRDLEQFTGSDFYEAEDDFNFDFDFDSDDSDE